MVRQVIMVPVSGVLCDKNDIDHIINGVNDTGLLTQDGKINKIQVYGTKSDMGTVCIIIELENLNKNIANELFHFKRDEYHFWRDNNIIDNQGELALGHIQENYGLYLDGLIVKWGRDKPVKSANKIFG